MENRKFSVNARLLKVRETRLLLKRPVDGRLVTVGSPCALISNASGVSADTSNDNTLQNDIIGGPVIEIRSHSIDVEHDICATCQFAEDRVVIVQRYCAPTLIKNCAPLEFVPEFAIPSTPVVP